MMPLLSTLALLQVTLPAVPARAQRPVAPMPPAAAAVGPASAKSPGPAAAPAASWLLAVPSPPDEGQRDPADSVYRLARRALERDELERAAALFSEVRTRFGKSAYAADAGYWEAFARYRAGGDANLAAARDALQRQIERYPKAATTSDARSLLTRVAGQLARRGDAPSAEAVLEGASRLAALSPIERANSTERESAPECEQSNTEERIEALNALMQVDAERAVPILMRVLDRRDPCTVRLRRKAVFIVSQKRRPGVEDVLLKSVQNDPDRQVREQAVFWLSQVGTDRAVDVLGKLVDDASDVGIQKKAVFSLSQLKLPAASEKLYAFASRRSLAVEVRADAIQWLGMSEGGSAQVRKLWSTLEEPQLKEKVLFAASQSRDGDNASWLLDVAADERESVAVRKKALFWAGQSPSIDLDALQRFYSKANDRELKQQYAFVLGQRQEPQAVDRLMAMAKSDPDREIRKKAIFWLSQSKDPRVAKFLEDLIGGEE
ncbi:MAG: HEAT repeat domain-containing protein [Gemmatimonadaceae bacterium]|nr:HEAT repeat domain-containing protein [Gemmatimonadaceae bacterium]